MLRFIAIITFFLGLTQISIAQATGNLSGRIYAQNEKGDFLAVLVQLSQNGSEVAKTTTDAKGYYEIKSLPAGTYKVKFSCTDFKTKVRNVSIVAGQTTKRDTKLELTVVPSIDDLVFDEPTPEPELEPVVVHEQEAVKQMAMAQKEMQRSHARLQGARSAKSYAKPSRGNRSFSNHSSGVGSTANESYASITENEFKMVSKDKLSTFSIDVDRASYSNVRRFLNNGQKPPKDAVRIEEMVNYFDYDYPQPKGEHPFSITTEASDCPWNTEAKLLHIGLQGKRIDMDNAPYNNLVFLMDVSGSMNSANKLPLVKSSLKLLVQNMRDEDKIAIVVYAGAAGMVLPSTKGSDRNKILAALGNLEAGGSTAGGAGIKLAYKIAKENYLEDGNNRIILTTDGDFNVGVSTNGDLEKLIVEKRNDNIFLSVLGFGTGNYKDSKMETLADKGNGNYAYIDNIKEAKKTLGKEMGATLYTIAKDVKIQMEFNPKFVKSYRLVGYENRLLNNEDFANDKKDAGELGAGHTVTALYEIILVNNTKKSNQDMMTVNLRYKQPKGTVSTLLSHPVKNNIVSLTKASDNFRFSASVAGFGMLLRESKFKNNLSYQDVIDLGEGAKGADKEGYRSEYISMVRNVNSMMAHAKNN